MSLGKNVTHFFDSFLNLLAFAAGTFAVLIMLLVSYLVIMRYIFHQPPAWIIEVCEYLLLYITFFGTAWLLRREGHVRVDLFYQALPPLWKKAFGFVTSIVGSASCFILAGLGLWVTWNNYQRGISSIQTISVPRWCLLGVIPLGSLLLAFQFIRNAKKVLHEQEGSKPTIKGS